MRWWSWSALVLAAWLVFVSSALGFAQVPGSPFATGGDAGALAFSPGGGLLATTGYDGDVSVFTVNPSTGALAAVAGSPFGGVGRGSSVAFSPGGGLLATTGMTEDVVSVFSVDPSTGALSAVAGSPFATGAGSSQGPASVAFSPGGGLLATANSGSVSVLSVNPTTGALTAVPGSPFSNPTGASSLAFSPGGGLLAATNFGASSVSMFSVDPSTGALSAVAGSPFSTGPESGPYSLAFSSRGGLLATANFGAGSVSVFSVNPSTGALSAVAGSPFRDPEAALPRGSGVWSVAFSPGGGLLAAANTQEVFPSATRPVHSVSLFSVTPSTGALRAVAGSPFSTPPYPGSVAFSPTGGLLATANGSVSVFSTALPNAPVISSARQSANRWREGNQVPSVTAKQNKKPRLGTTFSFTLNMRATVALAFTKTAPGRQVEHRCVAPTQHNRHRRGCTRTLAAGTFRLTARRGPNAVHFDGRISTTKKLKPGRYRLVLTATDTADGQQSTSRSLSFTILR